LRQQAREETRLAEEEAAAAEGLAYLGLREDQIPQRPRRKTRHQDRRVWFLLSMGHRKATPPQYLTGIDGRRPSSSANST